MNQSKTGKLRTYFNWSSGKDASLALYYLQQQEQYHIDRLLTSINRHHNRVSMHGLRRELLYQQAQALGLPLTTIELPAQPTMEVYNQEMQRTISGLQSEGYTHCGFGDIFLEDLRMYREEQLKPLNIQACFPLWKKDTKALLETFIDLGFRAITVAIQASLLDESFVGREIDRQFLQDLPPNVDPCGENGEFHTFCFEGPIFSQPVQFELGERVYREYKSPKDEEKQTKESKMGFWFADLHPV